MRNVKTTSIGVLGLLMVLGLYAQPVQAARVYAVNNSSHLIDVTFWTDGLIPLPGAGLDYTQRHEFSLESGKTYLYEDVIAKLSGEGWIYIQDRREPSCYREAGTRYYFLTITIVDAPDDNIKCYFIFK